MAADWSAPPDGPGIRQPAVGADEAPPESVERPQTTPRPEGTVMVVPVPFATPSEVAHLQANDRKGQ
jgi:hypothetical protein